MDTFIAMVKLFALLPGMVKQVEEVFPISDAGKEKQELIFALIKAAFDAVPQFAKGVTIDKVFAVAIPLISLIVNTFNKLGLFTKKTDAPAT